MCAGGAVGNRHIFDTRHRVQGGFGVEAHQEAVQLAGLEVGDPGGFLRYVPENQLGELRRLAVMVFPG